MDKSSSWIIDEFKEILRIVEQHKLRIFDRLHDSVLTGISRFLKLEPSNLEWLDVLLFEGDDTPILSIIALMPYTDEDFINLQRIHPERTVEEVKEIADKLNNGKKSVRVSLPLSLCEMGTPEEIVKYLETSSKVEGQEQDSTENLEDVDFDLDQLTDDQLEQLHMSIREPIDKRKH